MSIARSVMPQLLSTIAILILNSNYKDTKDYVSSIRKAVETFNDLMDPTLFQKPINSSNPFDVNNENWDKNYKDLIKTIEEKKQAES